jgi:IS5 family transposase
MKSEFVGEGLPAVDFAADEKGGDQGGRHASGWSKAKCRQKDRDARWTLDRGRSRRKPEPALPHRVEIAVPMFGYKSLSTLTGGTG